MFIDVTCLSFVDIFDGLDPEYSHSEKKNFVKKKKFRSENISLEELVRLVLACKIR